MSEEYSVGYDEGYQTGRNEAIDELEKENRLLRARNDRLEAELKVVPVVQQPAFYGFMDEEECCVNICYTPWAPGGPNNELPTAYYTTPPAAQPAVPLTDEQIVAANYPDGEENEATIAAPDVELIAFARAIEAKLRSKNNG